MKRMIAFALAVMLAFGMTACGDNTSSGTQSASSASAPGASPLIPDGPAPEINLITGEALAEGLAAGDRPVAVMVNNAQAALPQRGIGSADAVFEMVTEGGITRLLALYADKDTVPQVGPVRSARDQHLQCAMPLNSVIVHIGTSIYAENLLNQYQYSTINGMYLGSTSFVFDEARSAAGYANEHCWYTDAALIAAGMEKLGLSGTGASQALFDFVAHDAQPVVPAQGDAAPPANARGADPVLCINNGKELKPVKRMIAFALAVMLAFGMTACGDNTSSGTQSASSASAPGASPLIPDGPAPEINLITGEALAEGLAAGDRPVAVMVNNAQAALPQRGIGSADAVFEMVTEGGITRLLALYADKDTVPQVGPVRSARDQHLQCAMPLNSVIVHIGTSIYAENLLNQYQYSTINGMYLGSTSFVFDEARSAAGYANEHCWYTDAALIAAGMEKLGLSGTGASQALFDFVAHDAQPVVPAQGDAADVAFSFSDSGAVTLTYDAAAAKYLKTAYGAPQVDESTGAQLAFDNVLVLFTDIKLKNPDDPNNLVTDFAMSSGTGYYCYGGKFRAVTWEKGNPEDPLRLKDENGAALQVNVGKSYVAIVGKDREGTLLFGGVSPTGVIGGEGASSDAQSGAAASAEPEL